MRDDEKTRADFAVIMVGVAENYGQTITPEGGEMRFKALQQYEIADIRRAAMSIITSRKYTSMPTVADFLEHLGGGSAEDKAEVEAGKVLQAISSVGGYQSVVFDDPVTQAVIQQSFGGWAKLCQESLVNEEKWRRKEFARAYAAYARQGVSLYGYLPGQIEIANSACGYVREIPTPVMIGNREKAKEILSAGNMQAVERGERLSQCIARLPYNPREWQTDQVEQFGDHIDRNIPQELYP